MQLILPPDIETLIQKRLSTGVYAGIEDVLRQALEAQDAVESWTDEERQALATHRGGGFPAGPAWRVDRAIGGTNGDRSDEGSMARAARR